MPLGRNIEARGEPLKAATLERLDARPARRLRHAHERLDAPLAIDREQPHRIEASRDALPAPRDVRREVIEQRDRAVKPQPREADDGVLVERDEVPGVLVIARRPRRSEHVAPHTRAQRERTLAQALLVVPHLAHDERRPPATPHDMRLLDLAADGDFGFPKRSACYKRRMEYVEVGAGEPILMMHGIGLDHGYLRPWHDALADRARLIYYDMRTTGPLDHAVWLADAAALLDQLGLAKATLYGHSYGSWLALEFAARYPERVSRVIACATSPAFDYPDLVMENARRKDPALAEILAGAFAKLPTDDAEFARIWRTILPLYFHGEAPPILDHTQFSAHAFGCGMAALQGWSVVGRMPPVPLLAITGDDDYITPFAQARRLADGVPGARAVEIANAGHFPFVEQPEAYLAALRDFLSRAART